jgi:hypothetical protein
MRLTTNLVCQNFSGASIAVGSSEDGALASFTQGRPAATAQACDEGELGTLVITKGSPEGSVMIVAAFTPEGQPHRDVKDCMGPDYDGCIVAKRHFRFFDGMSLDLTVPLEESCAGVPCEGASTCDQGTCVSSQVTCNASGQCDLESRLPPVGESSSSGMSGGSSSGVQGGAHPLDGSPLADGAAVDATGDVPVGNCVELANPNFPHGCSPKLEAGACCYNVKQDSEKCVGSAADCGGVTGDVTMVCTSGDDCPASSPYCLLSIGGTASVAKCFPGLAANDLRVCHTDADCKSAGGKCTKSYYRVHMCDSNTVPPN